MWGLKEGTTEWSKTKHEVHCRSAQRIQELCFRNGGIYIKLGQHISQLVYLILIPLHMSLEPFSSNILRFLNY